LFAKCAINEPLLSNFVLNVLLMDPNDIVETGYLIIDTEWAWIIGKRRNRAQSTDSSKN